jgi:hypothetical protein
LQQGERGRGEITSSRGQEARSKKAVSKKKKKEKKKKLEGCHCGGKALEVCKLESGASF